MSDTEDTRLDQARKFYAAVVAGGDGSMRERLEQAFAFVPREHFLGPGPWQTSVFSGGKARYVVTPDKDPIYLYQNLLFALDADRHVNNGEPALHGQMIRALDPDRGDTILHIGCGTGYYTAILAQLVGPSGRVIAYEIDEALAARAARCLEPWDSTVSVVPGTGAGTGVQLPHANAVYVSAGATHPDPGWLDALVDGGRLVFPLSGGGSFAWGVTLLITRFGAEYGVRVVTRSAFIGCAGAIDEQEGQRVADALNNGALFQAKSLVRDARPDATAVLVGEGWWLSSRALGG